MQTHTHAHTHTHAVQLELKLMKVIRWNLYYGGYTFRAQPTSW